MTGEKGRAPCQVLVFAKAPIPGLVKTRLLSALSAESAAALHRQLVLNALATAARSCLGPVELWCSPSTIHPFFARCKQDYGVRLREQVEGDLGGRMHHAFEQGLGEAKRVILIGTDCPALSCQDLEDANRWLSDECDAVIGPAEDGGYVLLGLKRTASELFEEMPWGSGRVLEQTRRRLRELRWRWRELKTKWDVDRPEDYQRLLKERRVFLFE
jgi:uncharacterized protein